MKHEGDSSWNCFWRTQDSPKNLEYKFYELDISGKIETINTLALGKLAETIQRDLET